MSRKIKMMLLAATIATSGLLAVPAPALASCDGPAEIDPCPLVEFCRRATHGKLCSG
ncbi:MAG: hypothetical protein ACRD1T_08755 [Acidimicrobiia bacterium]